MIFSEAGDRMRRRILKPWSFWAYLWLKLPLAAAAGLRLRRLDENGCEVSLPGGWRTQNPFRSTYFGAQAMAAEMSTGAPAMVLAEGSSRSMSTLVREVRGSFTKKAVGPVLFRFAELAPMAAAVARAAASGEAETFVARSVGRMADGTIVAEFQVTWSFKRRD